MQANNVIIYNDIPIHNYKIYLDKAVYLDLVPFFNEETSILVGHKNKQLYTYYPLLSFSFPNHPNDYIVYTDNKQDKNGNIMVYVAKYNLDSVNVFEGYPKSEEEWNFIISILNAIFKNK